jgi:hypothetical protein
MMEEHMKQNRHQSIVIFVLVFYISSAAAGPNITGKWIMDVQSQMGSGTPVFELVQEGETVTGIYKGQLGESPVTGTVKEDSVELNINVDAMGQEMTIQYIGTLEEDGSMKGTVKFGNYGDGTFKGKKQE